MNVSKNVLLAPQNAGGFNHIKYVAQDENFTTLTALSEKEGIKAARQHVPDFVFVHNDAFSQNTGINLIRNIYDHQVIDTHTVLIHSQTDSNVASSRNSNDEIHISAVEPFRGKDIRILLHQNNREQVFNGNCRVTFIDTEAGKEFQSETGTSRFVEYTSPYVVVRGDNVPEWARDGIES